MTDTELRELLEQIDSKFDEIIPLLCKAGEALVDKARREKEVELVYNIGWEEGGINCLCLDVGKKGFGNDDEAFEWESEEIWPLFGGLKYLYFSAPRGLCINV